MRKIINGVYYVSFAISRLLSLVHTFLLKTLNLVDIGRGSVIFHRTKVLVGSRGVVKIGNNCRIGNSSIYNHVGMPFYTKLITGHGKILIGNNCRINGCYINASLCITIGSNCVMAAGVNIIDCNGHETNSSDRTKGVDKPLPIIIGNNVWVGVNAVILKGTIIGDNCVISAASVCRGVFPDNSLIQGNPARVTKSLQIANSSNL